MASLFGSVYGDSGMRLPAGSSGFWGNPTSSFSSGSGRGDSVEGNYKLYNSAVDQQSGDYDTIMQGYKNLLDRSTSSSPMLKPSGSYNPLTYEYNPTANATASLNTLRSLSETGGITSGEEADLRARGVSPIRAVYAGANRDIDRNRALRGGYSPGYQATKAKMARELSSLVSDKLTDVNAGIAEARQRGRLSSAPAYASAAGAENALQAQYGSEKANTLNDASKFNIMLPLEFGKYNAGINSQTSDILRGMASLYGTTPALSSLYGSQAQSAAQLQNLINQQGNQNNLQFFSQLLRS